MVGEQPHISIRDVGTLDRRYTTTHRFSSPFSSTQGSRRRGFAISGIVRRGVVVQERQPEESPRDAKPIGPNHHPRRLQPRALRHAGRRRQSDGRGAFVAYCALLPPKVPTTEPGATLLPAPLCAVSRNFHPLRDRRRARRVTIMEAARPRPECGYLPAIHAGHDATRQGTAGDRWQRRTPIH